MYLAGWNVVPLSVPVALEARVILTVAWRVRNATVLTRTIGMSAPLPRKRVPAGPTGTVYDAAMPIEKYRPPSGAQTRSPTWCDQPALHQSEARMASVTPMPVAGFTLMRTRRA